LSEGLRANGSDVSVVRVADGSSSSDARVIGELVNGSATSVAATSELLNESDIAVIQHEYGIYGGVDGDEVVDIIGGLRIPSIVVAHTVLKDPTPHQRWVLEAIAAMASQVVVMSEAASQRLCLGFDVDPRKVTTIGHGATVPRRLAPPARSDGPTLLTWGLLGPGKGIERVIDVMASLRDLPVRPRYLIAGRTHPKVLAADGEAYRNARAEQARLRGVADSVSFDASYRDVSSLTALVQSSAVVVLPYDSTDQVTSGVLVDAIASGRPVVATGLSSRRRASRHRGGHRRRPRRPGCAGVSPAPAPDRAAPGRDDGRRGRAIGPTDGVADRGERLSGSGTPPSR